MAGFRWQTSPAQVWPQGAERYQRAVERGVLAIAQRWAPQIENYMRSNAPWTDRTANARAALHSEINHEVGRMVELILSHGVYYGHYLEGWNPVANREMLRGGLYAIVNPSIDYFGPQIWRDVRRMLGQ